MGWRLLRTIAYCIAAWGGGPVFGRKMLYSIQQFSIIVWWGHFGCSCFALSYHMISYHTARGGCRWRAWCRRGIHYVQQHFFCFDDASVCRQCHSPPAPRVFMHVCWGRFSGVEGGPRPAWETHAVVSDVAISYLVLRAPRRKLEAWDDVWCIIVCYYDTLLCQRMHAMQASSNLEIIFYIVSRRFCSLMNFGGGGGGHTLVTTFQ